MKVNGPGRWKLRLGRNSWQLGFLFLFYFLLCSYILTYSRTWKKFLELGEENLVPKLYSDLLRDMEEIPRNW